MWSLPHIKLVTKLVLLPPATINFKLSFVLNLLFSCVSDIVIICFFLFLFCISNISCNRRSLENQWWNKFISAKYDHAYNHSCVVFCDFLWLNLKMLSRRLKIIDNVCWFHLQYVYTYNELKHIYNIFYFVNHKRLHSTSRVSFHH